MVDHLREEARRRREPLRDAAGGLERAIAGPARSGALWRERVQGRRLAVRAALEDHVTEVEGPDGLVEQIAADAPRLMGEMQTLAGEHGTLRRTITELERSVEALAEGSNEAAVARIREATMALLGALSRHRQRGADLLWAAYGVDIGGE